MRIAVAAILALVLISCTAEEDLPPGVELIDPAYGQYLVEGCSRPGPEGVTGFFRPEPGDITTLESNLSDLFINFGDRFESTDPMASPFEFADDSGSFAREYVGFEVAGQKFILGNIFYDPTGNRIHSGPTCIDDGGPQHFGVQYELETAKIRRIDFNVGLSPPYYEPIVIE